MVQVDQALANGKLVPMPLPERLRRFNRDLETHPAEYTLMLLDHQSPAVRRSGKPCDGLAHLFTGLLTRVNRNYNEGVGVSPMKRLSTIVLTAFAAVSL